MCNGNTVHEPDLSGREPKESRPGELRRLSSKERQPPDIAFYNRACEDKYRLCYLRGREGIIAALAEQLG